MSEFKLGSESELPVLNPEVTECELTASYAGHYAAMGNRTPDWARAEPFDKKDPWLPTDRGVEILDFGCGFGLHLSRLHASGFVRLEGVDACQETVTVAAVAAGDRARIFRGDGRRWLRENNGRYGLILLFDVLEHFTVEDGTALLKEARSALQTGGRLVVRTPNMQAVTAHCSRYIDLTHRSGFTESSLRHAFFAAGFTAMTILPDLSEWEPGKWRPWAPWRGLGLRVLLNDWLHRGVYALRERGSQPSRFGVNLKAFADKA